MHVINQFRMIKAKSSLKEMVVRFSFVDGATWIRTICFTSSCAQSVITEFLSDKRQLNIHHIKVLSEYFDVSADMFSK